MKDTNNIEGNAMKQDYSFFLFCQLVNDDLINVNNLSIPYDQLFPIMTEHFEVFKNFDSNMEISEYEAIELYFENSGTLLAELMRLDEENEWERPKPKGYSFLFDK